VTIDSKEPKEFIKDLDKGVYQKALIES